PDADLAGGNLAGGGAPGGNVAGGGGPSGGIAASGGIADTGAATADDGSPIARAFADQRSLFALLATVRTRRMGLGYRAETGEATVVVATAPVARELARLVGPVRVVTARELAGRASPGGALVVVGGAALLGRRVEEGRARAHVAVAPRACSLDERESWARRLVRTAPGIVRAAGRGSPVLLVREAGLGRGRVPVRELPGIGLR
ncbi:MAG: hypothetical protein M0Z33_03395, partial [Actinomycetota bacterium]|nr:hypothetical protein [Actinomycetota bacterium]